MTRLPGSTPVISVTHIGKALRVPGDVSISVTTNLPNVVTFAGSRDAMVALAGNLQRLAQEIENDA